MATKPPWPPIDGGRLVALATLRALAERGHRLRLVAPRDVLDRADDEAEEQLSAVCEPLLVPAPPRARLVDVARAQLQRRPLSLVRHERAAVTAGVATALASRRPDVVHAEQLQALAATEPARALGVPRVLRAQNVESDLWRGLAARRRPPLDLLLRLEASRLARAEGEAVDRVDATVTLTADDAARLRRLVSAVGAADAAIDTVPAPFDAQLEPGPPLAGDPAVVVFGSAGWPPNLDGARFFVERVWPLVRRRAPAARLHLFGFGALGARLSGVERHPAPADASTALARDSLLAVPLFIGSGIRMKILEAWARGVPVVATSTAAAGLVAPPSDDPAVLIADRPEDFAAALIEAHRPERRAPLVTAGRAALEAHSAQRVAAALEEIYRGAVAGAARTPSLVAP
ncbi:MAG: glycosyltransferase family 4 protein [Acidobacteriota bacterium]